MAIKFDWARIVCFSLGLVAVGACRTPRENLTDGGSDRPASGGRGAGGVASIMTSQHTGGAGGLDNRGGQSGTPGVTSTGGVGTGGAGAVGVGTGGGGTNGTGGSVGTGGGSPGDGGMPTDVAVPVLDATISCATGQKRCGGTCVAIDDPRYGCGTATCDATGCPQVVGATLVCQASACVVGTCGPGTKKCGSACVNVNDPAYGCVASTCDASACPSAGVGGSVACQAGACVIATCGPATKKCANKCVSLTDPSYGCGATSCDASSCPAAGTGTLICQGGTCVIGSCGSGTKKCGDKCVPMDANNGCADSARCTSCASNQTCVGTPTTCQCVPNTVAVTCAGKACGPSTNNCGQAITCPNTCTGVNTCGGGPAGPNVCGCRPDNVAACANKLCGPATNNCNEAITCANLCSGVNTCGGGNASVNDCGCTPRSKAVACGTRTCDPVSNGCGGTISCGSCTGRDTCVSGTCRCSPLIEADACLNKPCGTVPDGCTGTITCVNMCALPPPEAIGTCTGNTCGVGCASDTTPLQCSTATAPACGRWKLDTAGTQQDWSLVPTPPETEDASFGPLTLSAPGEDFNGQGRSLSVPFRSVTAGQLVVKVPLCPRAGTVGQLLKNKHVTVHVKFVLDSSPAPVADQFVAVYTSPGAGLTIDFKDGRPGFVFGSWITLDGTIEDTVPVTHIVVGANFNGAASGTMFVDDLYIR